MNRALCPQHSSSSALNVSSLADLPWSSRGWGLDPWRHLQDLLNERTCLPLLPQDTGMLAWGPQLSPGSGPGCGHHQPPPPTLMSFGSMQMPKVGLSSFWSLALGRAGCVCVAGALSWGPAATSVFSLPRGWEEKPSETTRASPLLEPRNNPGVKKVK